MPISTGYSDFIIKQKKEDGKMVYESQMEELAKGAISLHGKMREVVLLDENESLLVFSDGKVLSVESLKAGFNIRRESYALQVAAQLGGTNPFSLLTFGYSGTGPKCYSTFLSVAGFKSTNVEDIDPPLKLKEDGTRVRGSIRGESIEWEDGSDTPVKKKWWQFWK